MSFDIPYNLLLKAGRVILDDRNHSYRKWICMKISVYLAKSCVCLIFFVASGARGSKFLVFVSSLDFFVFLLRESIRLANLSTVSTVLLEPQNDVTFDVHFELAKLCLLLGRRNTAVSLIDLHVGLPHSRGAEWEVSSQDARWTCLFALHTTPKPAFSSSSLSPLLTSLLSFFFFLKTENWSN